MANRNPSPSTRFQPGMEWKGNPTGRPPGKSLTATLREMLDRTTWQGRTLPEGKTVAHMVAEMIVRQALGGDYPFVAELLNRTEGKVKKFAAESRTVTRIEVYRGSEDRPDAAEELERNRKAEPESRRRSTA